MRQTSPGESLFVYFLLFWGNTHGIWNSRGGIGAAAAGRHLSHSNAGSEATSVTYTMAHSNTKSLTH